MQCSDPRYGKDHHLRRARTVDYGHVERSILSFVETSGPFFGVALYPGCGRVWVVHESADPLKVRRSHVDSVVYPPRFLYFITLHSKVWVCVVGAKLCRARIFHESPTIREDRIGGVDSRTRSNRLLREIVGDQLRKLGVFALPASLRQTGVEGFYPQFRKPWILHVVAGVRQDRTIL